MSGPKRTPDKLNTIGVVVVGICGAVLVYVTIVALQAFYMDDTSEIQTMADYGGQDTTAREIRQGQTGTLTAQSTPNAAPSAAGQVQTYRIPVKYAMKYVIDAAKVDPSNLIPIHGKSDKATVLPVFGRGKPIDAPPGSGSGSAATPPGMGAGSAVPTPPTGGMGPGGGAPPAGAGSNVSTDPKTPATTEPKTPKKDTPKKDTPKKDTPKKDTPKKDAAPKAPAKGNAP
jgi:hypothetical protein